MASADRKLYTYWRSQASFRVRVALKIKDLPFESTFLDLLKGDQFEHRYSAVNPGMAVPTLIEGDGPPLVQSLAILEYLEEQYPTPPLLPGDSRLRAHARALAHIVSSDAHPLIVPRVRKFLEEEMKLDEAMRQKWIRHWLDLASETLERTLSSDPRTGRFCCGDTVSIADICMVAHLTSATMLYKGEIGRYPTLARIHRSCMDMEAFASMHPLRQPDAPDASQAGQH